MKGQMGDITLLGWVLLMVGVMFAVGIVVLSSFQEVGTPTQSATVTNSTNANNPIAYSVDKTIWIPYSQATYGEFRQGQLTFTSTNSSATIPAENFSVKVNGNQMGRANGYNTSATWIFPLTAGQLVNGLNNVTYTLGNTTNISSTSMTFNYTRQQDLSARNTVGSVIGSFDTLVQWLPIIIVVLVVFVILGLLGFGMTTGGTKRKR
jgi:ATP-dependent Zn protease